MKNVTHYFAYGSNMHVARLRRRLNNIVSVERARLDQYVLTFGKRGRDGSAKCNIEAASDGRVFGVLFRLHAALLNDLDAIEGFDYARIAVVPIGLDSGRRYQAYCYRAKARAADAESLPFEWYHAFVVEGARMHDLPESYVAALARAPSRVDPNRFRRRRQHRKLDGNAESLTSRGKNTIAGPKSGWLIDGRYRDRYHDM